jgi:DNA-binding beta-propeller fold protein YncE
LASAIVVTLCALAGALAFASAPALAASNKGVVGYFGGTGTAGGLFFTPGGVAVNDITGNVYVVDSGNNRVQEFSSSGAFIRTWGLGVVSTGQDSGGTSTVQKVTISGTSGSFTLSLSGQVTGVIAYDAPSSSIEATLDALPSIGGVGGSVAVVGEGTSINPYEVTFGGSLRGSEVAPITVNTSGLGVPVGTSLSCAVAPVSATSKTYQWLRNGVAIAGATSSIYTTTSEDAGEVVQCQVFAINSNAGSTQASAAWEVVSPAPATAPPIAPTSIEKPAIASGELKVPSGPGGAVLTCNPGAWTGVSSFSYRWYRNGVALAGNGANTSVYTVQSADLTTAAVFQCAVTGTDAGGSVTLISANLATEEGPSPAAPKATATATVPVLAMVTRTVVGAPAFEVCNATSSPQDVCKTGVAAGASAGAMSTPEGVAIDQATGDVYVTDQENHRVDEFTKDGAFVRMFGKEVNKTKKTNVCSQEEIEKAEGIECKNGVAGAGAGEFGASIGYPAVDPSTGDVYVADPANRRVDVFEEDGAFVRAFGWGVVSNATKALQVCTSTCVAGLAGSEAGEFGTGSPTRVAVNAQGDVYVVDGANFRVQEFSSAGALIAFQFGSAALTGTTATTTPTDVAVEQTLGDVLGAREPSSPAEHLVYELDAGGGDLLVTDGQGAKLPAPNGLAVGPSGGSVYFSTVTNNRVFVLGTIAPPTATVEAASGTTAGEVTLHGTVDPDETPSNGLETTWQFEYSTNQTEWTKTPAGKLAASTSPVAVRQTIMGLEGHTVYYVRLRAEKEYAAGSATSTIAQLTTPTAAPTISEESVFEVKATSATFSAQINPEHLTTTYHFEYDTTPYTTGAAHGMSIPVPGEDIGEGLGNVTAGQHPQNLKPDTNYHYRVVAVNSAEVADGPEQAFTTQTEGENLVLPDGRAWEMVSPPDKNGAAIDAMEPEGGLAQAAAGGGAFAWDASAPIGSEVAGNRIPEWSQIFSTRGANGWSSRDIAGAHETDVGVVPGDRLEYMLFSSDLSLGLVEPKGKQALSSQATGKTIYLRDDAGDTFLPLVTAANVLTGADFDGHGEEGESPKFMGATSDLSHVVFSSQEALTENALTRSNLYEWAGGQLRLVSVLPKNEGGGAAAKPSLGHPPDTDSRQAISGDGSRVVWTNYLTGSNERLYMRDMTTGETIRLDAVQNAPVGEPTEAEANFETASENGHKVFFTDVQELTTKSTASLSEPDLYMFETTNGEDEPLKGTLTDLTVDNNAGESADVQGLLPGASEDGSYVYLVAKGVLNEAENAEHEKAAPGANNLYVLHDTGTGWTTRFIARLSGEDEHDWAGGGGGSLVELTARVSPDGRYLAFMSDRGLTGYDNRDANSGVPDEEVFLYHAGADTGAGSLVCVSCNPTGARPVGLEDPPSDSTSKGGSGGGGQLLVDEAGLWGGRWLAANIPGWPPMELGVALYQSRYLSGSGRLFFNSNDALVPQDVNGREDVYEYEPPGDGNCEAQNATFSARSGGCVDLISSGTSSEESAFLDASEGGEAFFLTAAKLAPQDYDTSMDVYDAHECTAQSPCTSPSFALAPCTTPEACRAPSAPQPAIFGAPPSQTFSGSGNAAPAPAATVKVKAKLLTRAQKLANALQACERKLKKKQSTCEKRARQKYGTEKAKKRLESKKTSKERR